MVAKSDDWIVVRLTDLWPIVEWVMVDYESTYGLIIKSDHIFMFIHNQVLAQTLSILFYQNTRATLIEFIDA